MRNNSPKPFDALFQHVIERFRRHVAPGDAGAAGGDHHIDLRIRDPGAQMALDRVGIVFLDRPRGDAVAGLRDAIGERVARRVVGQRARVRHGEDGDIDRDEWAVFIDACHGAGS